MMDGIVRRTEIIMVSEMDPCIYVRLVYGLTYGKHIAGINPADTERC